MKATAGLNDTRRQKVRKKCGLLGKTAWLTRKSAGKPNDTANRVQQSAVSFGGMLFRGVDMGRYDYTVDFFQNRRVNGAAGGSRVKTPQSHGRAHEIGKLSKNLAKRLTFHSISKGYLRPFFRSPHMKHKSMVQQVQETPANPAPHWRKPTSGQERGKHPLARRNLLLPCL